MITLAYTSEVKHSESKDGYYNQRINNNLCCDGLRNVKALMNCKSIFITHDRKMAYNISKPKLLLFYNTIIKEMFPKGVTYKVTYGKLKLFIDLEEVEPYFVNIIWALFRIPFYTIGNNSIYTGVLTLTENMPLWRKIIIANFNSNGSNYKLFSGKLVKYIPFEDYKKGVTEYNKNIRNGLFFRSSPRFIKVNQDFFNFSYPTTDPKVIEIIIDNVEAINTLYSKLNDPITGKHLSFKRDICNGCSPSSCSGCNKDHSKIGKVVANKNFVLATNKEIKEEFQRIIKNQETLELLVNLYN